MGTKAPLFISIDQLLGLFEDQPGDSFEIVSFDHPESSTVVAVAGGYYYLPPEDSENQQQISVTAKNSAGDELQETLDVNFPAPGNEQTGSDGPDFLFGGQNDDHLSGNDGSDFIMGLTGNDLIDGGAGDDYISAGGGNDIIVGGGGSDFIITGRDADLIVLNDSNDADFVSDFKLGEDKLLITLPSLLNDKGEVDGSRIRLTDSLLGTTLVQVDLGSGFKTLAELRNINSGNTTVAEILANIIGDPGQSPPDAENDTGAGFETDEDTAFTTGSVLINDSDPDGDSLTVDSIDATATTGLVTDNGDGTFDYDPNGAFESLQVGESATDSFDYTVSDANGGTDTATVTIGIEGVNDDPDAVDDGGESFTTDKNNIFITGSVLTNDTDVEGDTLSVDAIDDTGTQGVVIDNGDGTFDYDPNGAFESLQVGESAIDTFSYTVSDGNGGTDTATVSITINPGIEPPVAEDDFGEGYGTDEDTSFTTGSVLANDTDVDGDTLTVSAIDVTGTQGVVIDNGDGTFDYDPNGAFESLQAGESDTDSFDYTVSDGNGGTDTATVTIGIEGVNDDPDAVDDGGDGFSTGKNDTLITPSVLTNDTDVEGDTLSVDSIDTSGTLGLVTDNGDGTFGYDPNGAFNDLGPEASETDTFSYTVSDGNGGTDTATVSITVNGGNNPPVAVADTGEGYGTDEDTTFTTVSVLANDTDPDGDSLTVDSIDTTATTGLVIDNGDGTFDYDPNGAFETLQAGESDTDSFNYTVADGNGGFDTATVTIGIEGVNDDPDAFDDGGDGFSTGKNETFTTLSVLTNDTDVEGDTLSIDSIDTTGTLGLVTDNGDGTFGYDPNGAFDDLGPEASETDTFSYTVSDGNGGTDTATVSITVNGGNNPPVAVADTGEGYGTDEDTTFTTVSVLANDTDPDGDSLTVDSIDTTATTGLVIDNSNGTFDYDPNGAFESLQVGESATDSFDYTVADGNGGFDTATVTIGIEGVNDDPDAFDDGGDGFSTGKNETFTTLSVLTNDTDVEGDTLSVDSIDTTGTLGLVTDNGDGTFSYDPNGAFDDLGSDEFETDTFTYTVSDGNGGTDTATISITVTGGNIPPIATADSGVGFGTDEDTTFTTTSVLTNDTDADGDTLSVSAFDDTGTQGVVIDNGDGTFDYDPNGAFETLQAGESDTDSFDYTVSDGNGGTDTATVTIGIEGVNDDPDAVDDGGEGFSVDKNNTLITGSVLANDTDVEGDTLTVDAIDTTGTLGLVTDNGDGTFSYDPNGAFNDLGLEEFATDTFTYTVSDGNGGTDTATISITVTGGNIPPIATADSGVGFGTDEDTSFTTTSVLTNDTDADGDTLSVSAIDDTGTQGVVIDNGDGTFDYDPNGAFETLQVGKSATDSFDYTVSDGNGGTDTATVTIDIDGVNDDPNAVDDGGEGFSVDKNNTLITDSALTNDTDVEGDTLSVESIDTTGTLGLVTDNSDGTFGYDPNGAFNDLGLEEFATDTFTYTVSDGNGGTDTATISITVNGSNNPPVAVADAGEGYGTDEDTLFTTSSVLANDTDADGDTLTVSAIDDTGAQGVVIDNGDGTFDYDPNGAFETLQAGESDTDSFDYTVSDGNGGTDTATVTIGIDGVNDDPEAVDDGGTGFSTKKDETFTTASVLTNDTDVEGDTLSVDSIDTTGTLGLVTDNGDGTFGYDPNGAFNDLGPEETATDTFTYTVSDGNGGTDTATVAIGVSGDVPPPPPPGVEVTCPKVLEGVTPSSGNRALEFIVTLPEASLNTINISYRVLSGSAAEADDYINGESSIRFLPGETSKTITVTTVGNETLDEADEAVVLELYNPTGGMSFVGGVPILRATGFILDDDGTGNDRALFTSSPVIVEGDGGQKNAVFELKMSEASTADITVTYQTVDGSATAGEDYVAQLGTVTFIAGQTEASVSVPVNGDATVETSENFSLILGTNPALAEVTSGIGTILDDDAGGELPTLSIEGFAIGESNGSSSDTFRYTITLSQASSSAIDVSYRTLFGSAAEADDYINAESSIRFSAGETSKTITVSTVGNETLDEADEAVVLELYNISGGASFAGDVPTLRATGFILDDDGSGNDRALFTSSPVIVEGDSGQKAAVFELKLSEASTADITVTYQTADGSATAGEDYVAQSGTVTFLAGQTVASVSVAVNGDATVETSENFSLILGTNPALAEVTSGIGTILDDDAGGELPTLSIEGFAIGESNGSSSDTFRYTITLSQASSSAIDVSYRTLFGSAAEADDYINGQSSIRFSAGETSKTITVSTVGNETLDEADEAVVLELYNISGGASFAGDVPTLRATGFILDDDGSGNDRALFTSSPVIVEGDSGQKAAVFELKLSEASTADITVTYQTADGSATAGEDYVAQSGTVTFLAGQTVASVSVAVNGDATVETSENFSLILGTNPALAEVTSGIGTILDDDAGGELPTLSIEGFAIGESNGSSSDTFRYTITLSQASSSAIDVSYRTLFGSAAEADDYINGQSSIRFSAGETSKTITVSTVGNETLDEADEAVVLELYNISGGASFAGDVPTLRATGFILDDDGSGNDRALFTSSPVIVEGDSGQKAAVFELKLSEASTADITVTYQTADGSATAGEDYVAQSGTVTFLAGQTVASVSVAVNGDATVETSENFSLILGTNPALAEVTSGIGTILDDDAGGELPTLSIEGFAIGESNGSSSDTFRYTITLSQASSSAIDVSYRTLFGSAAEADDYINGQSSIRFSAGETSKTITVSTVGNETLDEADEAVVLELYNISGGASFAGDVPTLRATGFILDDDGSGNDRALFTSSPVIVEGDSGQKAAVFELKLSEASTADITVTYQTADGSATAGEDYVAQSGTVTFLAGQTVASVSVAVNGDATVETSENFSLILGTNPALAEVTSGIGTILDDDAGGELPTLSIEGFAIGESNGSSSDTFRYTITLSQASSSAIDVSYRTLSGSATLGDDFFSADSIIRFSPGQTSKTINVSTVGNETLDEADEAAVLELYNISGGATFAGGVPALRATGFILDDDGTGNDRALFTSSPVIVEGDSGQKNAVFELKLSEPSTTDITVTYQTVDGSATAGADYTAKSGSVTFLAGQTVAAVAVAVSGDTSAEGSETFSLTVGSNAALAEVTGGTATIEDDDSGSGLAALSSAGLNFARLEMADPEPELFDFTALHEEAPPGLPLSMGVQFGQLSSNNALTGMDGLFQSDSFDMLLQLNESDQGMQQSAIGNERADYVPDESGLLV